MSSCRATSTPCARRRLRTASTCERSRPGRPMPAVILRQAIVSRASAISHEQMAPRATNTHHDRPVTTATAAPMTTPGPRTASQPTVLRSADRNRPVCPSLCHTERRLSWRKEEPGPEWNHEPRLIILQACQGFLRRWVAGRVGGDWSPSPRRPATGEVRPWHFSSSTRIGWTTSLNR